MASPQFRVTYLAWPQRDSIGLVRASRSRGQANLICEVLRIVSPSYGQPRSVDRVCSYPTFAAAKIRTLLALPGLPRIPDLVHHLGRIHVRRRLLDIALLNLRNGRRHYFFRCRTSASRGLEALDAADAAGFEPPCANKLWVLEPNLIQNLKISFRNQGPRNEANPHFGNNATSAPDTESSQIEI